jgi:hypothetical protein
MLGIDFESFLIDAMLLQYLLYSCWICLSTESICSSFLDC